MASKKTKQQLLDEISRWSFDGMDIPPTIKNTKAEILTYYTKYRNISPPDPTPIYEQIEMEVGITEIKQNVGEEIEARVEQKEQKSTEKADAIPILEQSETIEKKEEKKKPIKAKRNPPANGYECYDIIISHLKVSKDPFNFLYMKVEDRTTMQEDMKKWHANRYAHIPPEQRPSIKYGKLDYKTFFRDVLSQHEGKLTTLKDMYDRFHV